SQPDISLINYQELVAIQVIWYRDNIFQYKVSDIYHNVFGISISLDAGNEGLIREKDLLRRSCEKNPQDFELINNLLVLQKTKTNLMNNRGIQNVLENQLEQFIQEKQIS